MPDTAPYLPGRSSGAAPLGWVVLGALAILAMIVLGTWWWMGRMAAPPDGPPRMKLDINRAEARELELLPGVGPTRAARIVAARRKRGGFRSLSELDERELLGPGSSERLATYLKALPAADAVGERAKGR